MQPIYSNNQVIFATAGYDHTIRFWEAHSGNCYKVLSHNESVGLNVLKNFLSNMNKILAT